MDSRFRRVKRGRLTWSLSLLVVILGMMFSGVTVDSQVLPSQQYTTTTSTLVTSTRVPVTTATSLSTRVIESRKVIVSEEHHLRPAPSGVCHWRWWERDVEAGANLSISLVTDGWILLYFGSQDLKSKSATCFGYYPTKGSLVREMVRQGSHEYKVTIPETGTYLLYLGNDKNKELSYKIVVELTSETTTTQTLVTTSYTYSRITLLKTEVVEIEAETTQESVLSIAVIAGVVILVAILAYALQRRKKAKPQAPSAAAKFCTNCGSFLAVDATYCAKCGAKQ